MILSKHCVYLSFAMLSQWPIINVLQTHVFFVLSKKRNKSKLFFMAIDVYLLRTVNTHTHTQTIQHTC